MLSSHHWCILTYKNQKLRHRTETQPTLLPCFFLYWYCAGLNWEKKYVKASYWLVCGDTQIQVICQAVLFGEHLSHCPQQPTREPGSQATGRELRTRTNFVSGQGRHRASGLRGAGGTKSSAKCQHILQQHPCHWQCLESHQAVDAGHRSPGK